MRNDEFISSTSAEDSWWDNGISTTGEEQGTNRITIDARNVVSREVPDEDDNNILPSLHTKADEVEENNGTVLKDMLNAPPFIRCTIVNNESTISSNITTDTRMEIVEINIGNLGKSFNHMAHMLTLFIKEMKQGTNIAPEKFNKMKMLQPKKYYKYYGH